MKTLTLAHATRRILLAAAVATTATQSVHAAWAWNGAGSDDNWSTAANWNKSASGNTGAYFRDSLEPYTKKTVNFSQSETFAYNLYVDGGTTESDPLVFTASTDANGLTLSSYALHISYAGFDGYLCIKNGTYSFNKGVVVGDSGNHTGKLIVDGGTVNVSDMVVGNTSCTGALTVNGGAVKTSTDLILGKGDGNSSASGTLNLNGGTVTVVGKWTKSYKKGAGTINLNGGTLVTKTIVADGSGSSMTVNFNGGTLKANDAYSNGLFYNNGGSSLTVNVKAGGGTIDSGNFAISIPVAISGTGGLTFKGGKTITLGGTIGWTGGTTIAAGTTVKVDTAAKKDALLGSGMNTLKVIPSTGTHTLMTITGDGVFSDDDLSKVSLAEGNNADSVFSISGDRKSLIANIYTGDAINKDSATLVFPGKALADLATHTLRARMQGNNFDADGTEVTFFDRQDTMDGDTLAKVTYQLQAIDESANYHYTKDAKVEFTANENGVYAKLAATHSNYGTPAQFGVIRTPSGTNNYIPYDFKLVESANAISVNFAHSDGGLDTTSSVRYGAGDYAVPYTSWNNMSVSQGSSATFGGATFKQTTTSGQYQCVDLNKSTDVRYGYLDDSGLTVVVDVTDIPYEFYRIVTYHASDAADVKFGYVTINGIDYTGKTDTTVKGNAAWGATGTRNKAFGLREGVNYLVSDLMVASSAKITGHREKPSSPTYRGSIAAIQIVESSLPTYKATIDDGGAKTFSALSWETALPALLTTGDQIVLNVNENTTLTLDYDIDVYAIKFNVASGKTLTLVGKTLAAEYICGSGNILNNGTFVKIGDGTVSWPFNVDSTGETIVSSGTLKVASKTGSGTAHTVRVKSGATFDANCVADFTVNVILEEGAKFANTGDPEAEIGAKKKQTVKITLEGNATAAFSNNFGLLGPSYGATTLALGSNTLTLEGSKKHFWLCNTTITGDGTIYVDHGWLHPTNTASSGDACTLNIPSGGGLFLEADLTVANFVNGADSGNIRGDNTLTVTGQLTPGSAAIPKLTLASGATVKATGTAQTVSTTFSASGTVYIDALNILADTIRAGNVPVLTVPAGAATGNVTWRVKDSQLAGALAKWFEDEGGTTKTLYLCKPTGLMVIFK